MPKKRSKVFPPKVIENNFIGKLTISRNAESVICVNETSSGNATITLHISEFVDLINNTVTAVNTTLSEADLTHVHEKSELQKEVVAFIVDFLKPILTTPIKGYDPYNVPQTGTTAIEIIADGYNAFGEGNEAFASEELKNQREEWRTLVKSEDFSKLVNEQYVNAVNGLFADINDREKSEYKILLNTLCSVPVDMSKLMTIEGSTAVTGLVTSLIGSCDNLGALLKSILQGINTVSLLAGNNPVSGALSKLCGDVVSGVNLAMTTDTNVEEDRNLNIGSVRFASEKNSGKAVAVYAWYKDGALVDVSRTDVDVKQGNNATYFETGKTNFDFGKIFVWDSLEGMKPLKILSGNKKKAIDYQSYTGKWNWERSEPLESDQSNWNTYDEAWVDIARKSDGTFSLEYYHQKHNVHLYVYDVCTGYAEGSVIIGNTVARKWSEGPALAKFKITLTLYDDSIWLEAYNLDENGVAFSGMMYR